MNTHAPIVTLALDLGFADEKPIVLDRSYLARFTLGNFDLEREVLGLFAANAPLYIDRMLHADTPGAWIDAAHTLRGSAAALGISHLAKLAGAAERLDVFSVGATGNLADAKSEVVETLRLALKQALAAIDGLEPRQG